MPKRGAIALSLTALAFVLLLNFQGPSGFNTVAGSSGVGSGAGTGAGTRQGTGQTVTARTITGPTVSTRWGAVQVSVVLDGSQITDVRALQLPSGDRRSQSISSRSEPVLRSQALKAQSASIDGVSGATYTSVAYARSLQAALDSAGI